MQRVIGLFACCLEERSMEYLLWLKGRSQKRIYSGHTEFTQRLERILSGIDLVVQFQTQRIIQFDLHLIESIERCEMTSERRWEDIKRLVAQGYSYCCALLHTKQENLPN